MDKDQIYLSIIIIAVIVFILFKIIEKKSRFIHEAASVLSDVFMAGIAKGEMVKSILRFENKENKKEINEKVKKEAVNFIVNRLKENPIKNKIWFEINHTSVGNMLEDILHGAKKIPCFKAVSYFKSLI